MEAEMLARLEKLLGRELENSEKMRLQRIQDILKIGPNDALWSIIAALEYQRAYYEELPKKIHKTTEEILAEWSAAIRENLVVPQKKDGEKSAEQTRFTSLTWVRTLKLFTVNIGSHNFEHVRRHKGGHRLFY